MIMHSKAFSVFSIIMALLVSASLVAIPGEAGLPQSESAVQDLPIFKVDKFNRHLRMPHDGQIQLMLARTGVLAPGDLQDDLEAALLEFKQEWQVRNPVTSNPAKLRELLGRERSGSLGLDASAVSDASNLDIKVLAVPVEFIGTDTFTYSAYDEKGRCYDAEVTTSGPLHNQIAPPGPRDNNTVWYEDSSPELYTELFFASGPKAGVIVNHPNLGPVDLRGSTMANYYLEQSEGAFAPTGLVYPQWLQSQHSEGWYGADSCEEGWEDLRADELIRETVDLLNAADPGFPWQDFDADGDGKVDNYTVIHAGMGQEAGGGAQGDFAIWSHAFIINHPHGYLACESGSPGCPDREIHVYAYSVDPENIDIGVITEEFGHAAFGLPDIYATDYQFSASNWSHMESGSWNGILGGMQPAPFPLWFRYVVGWSQPVEIDYLDAPSMTVLGQHSIPPKHTEQGLKINLPDQEVFVDNQLPTSQAWWSDRGDQMEHTLSRPVDLTGAASPIFSFLAYWDIEADWDYGYVEVSEDGGATWESLPDMDGIFTDNNKNGTLQGWGLTGTGQGVLSIDLSGYSGQAIWLRLRYSTDWAVQGAGWWAASFLAMDGDEVLFSFEVDDPENSWAVDGWMVTPVTRIFPQYYLVEWRNYSGFDRGILTAYQTVYFDEDEWEVDRAPYTAPGALIWLRNTAHNFDYTLGDSVRSGPSWGPKHALTVVDSHPFPRSWDTFAYATGAPVRVSGRVDPGDATFTLQDTTTFTLRLGYDPFTGVYADEPLEIKTFEGRPPVSQFHDSLGYYPGLYFSQAPTLPERLFFWDIDASVVIPAQSSYTTRVTGLDNLPYQTLYGKTYRSTVLGSGNPGDSGVQFGLHLAVTRQSRKGDWAEIAVWNSPHVVDLTLSVDKGQAAPGDLLTYTLQVTNLSPISQTYIVHDPLPAKTTYVSGPHYRPELNAIYLEGSLPAYGSASTTFVVQIDRNAPRTSVTNTAYLHDDAHGDIEQALTVISPKPGP
jgi:immune inhibitor A